MKLTDVCNVDSALLPAFQRIHVYCCSQIYSKKMDPILIGQPVLFCPDKQLQFFFFLIPPYQLTSGTSSFSPDCPRNFLARRLHPRSSSTFWKESLLTKSARDILLPRRWFGFFSPSCLQGGVWTLREQEPSRSMPLTHTARQHAKRMGCNPSRDASVRYCPSSVLGLCHRRRLLTKPFLDHTSHAPAGHPRPSGYSLCLSVFHEPQSPSKPGVVIFVSPVSTQDLAHGDVQ